LHDLSSYRSFEQAKQWLQELRENHSSDKIVIFALGNKRDLPRQVDRDFVKYFW
jgi:GTPase SAR1 family protein